ncbi:acyl carrier protein [Rhizobium leguminosarum]|uniref:acyl carrier protein n=1 Tax=Rhizobium leguminosarum TaxID=384 RepID=UPI001C96E9C0|nr:acyl carrier protein [Rhizobium leguminosarum]MBY5663145.1 acyl carrier protein [Rhizobium leguminosarum]MBY5676348.1 acyl carrier protein [Rhizobium leguminosarum]MBY5716737.1 acyl carrier protein [Rhizobium leguminosarum]
MREAIRSIFNELWSEDHAEPPPILQDDTILLETGVDSMAFAVFVARLDEELGFDPFTIATEAVYPRTFGEFVSFYEKYAPKP